jgi:4-hydroxy-3-methylbut-2-enyl diphosphate reductase
VAPATILRAEHLGMCFGVRDAIALARGAAAREPVTIFGDLVHNEAVLADLRAAGVQIQRDPDQITTETVVVTAHGASERTLAELRARNPRVLEATCPLVRHAHDALKTLVRAGFHPVVIGQRGHVEVLGLTEDHPDCDVILHETDLAHLSFRERFGVVSQTTQPIDRVRALVEALRRRFPTAEVRFADTVCQPTKLRQSAAERLALVCDVVVVIGGAHSNNTRELVATCRRHCDRVHHVQTADHLDPSWFLGAKTIGITAGTSTPDPIIDAVEARIRGLTEAPTASRTENLLQAATP